MKETEKSEMSYQKILAPIFMSIPKWRLDRPKIYVDKWQSPKIFSMAMFFFSLYSLNR